MVTYLSPAWFELHRRLAEGLPERPGVTARVQLVITGAPGGEVRSHQTVVDGRFAELELGEDPDADVVLTQTHRVAVEIAKGELDAGAAFMQGRIKVVGGMGRVMALMPLTQSDEYLGALEQLDAQTDY